MGYSIRRVRQSNPDFIALVSELNLALVKLVEDSGENSFCAEDTNDNTDGFVVVYLDEKPVACGGFRKLTDETCELKRMFSKKLGAGSYLVKALEKFAKEKGYISAVLSTRKLNGNAVKFYKKHSYTEIEAFGKYVGVDHSTCMGKQLVH